MTERADRREWLVTNGLGGYASGTVSGIITRRYHGVLVASLPAPMGRTVMLTQLAENLVVDDFYLELGVPNWRLRLGDVQVEKRIVMPYGRNTTHVTYRALDGDAVLRLDPAVHFKSYEAAVSVPLIDDYRISGGNDGWEITGPAHYPSLRLQVDGAIPVLQQDPRRVVEVVYPVEGERGYDATGDLWSPGQIEIELRAGEEVTLILSTESWEVIRDTPPASAFAQEKLRRTRLLTLSPSATMDPVVSALTIAADQFIINPAGRPQAKNARTIIAGYHWFTDWGRDTMISLEGLTLATGRFDEAAQILQQFATHARDGLIPNMFPDGETEGLYHTADATLWFFHAVDRYVSIADDRVLLEKLLPTLHAIIDAHMRGTSFGIGVDQSDGLLTQGADGYQLTWMDAKCDGWVVTPRRGKAVEINALWYNALRVLEHYEVEAGNPARAVELRTMAERAQRSFNARFWNEQQGYLYDVVDGPAGDDPACRPNQVFAISLPNPILEERYWPSVMSAIEQKLLTPYGLRSLSPDHADYCRNYHGDLRTRDAAYQQGTV